MCCSRTVQYKLFKKYYAFNGTTSFFFLVFLKPKISGYVQDDNLHTQR